MILSVKLVLLADKVLQLDYSISKEGLDDVFVCVLPLIRTYKLGQY